MISIIGVNPGFRDHDLPDFRMGGRGVTMKYCHNGQGYRMRTFSEAVTFINRKITI